MTESRKETEREMLGIYVQHMKDLSSHYRTEMRGLIRRYRLCRTSGEICEIRSFYLQAERIALQDHMNRVFKLYREAGRDLQAMRRRAAKRGTVS